MQPSVSCFFFGFFLYFVCLFVFFLVLVTFDN